MADPSAPARVIGRQRRKHDPIRLTPTTWLAGAIYLVLALWTIRAILPAPSQVVPLPEDFPNRPAIRVVENDYRMVVGVVATHADKLLGNAGDLATQGQCYPLWRPYTLGEHMFGTALLAALPLRLFGDPVVAFNVAFAASLWIAAMAMFLLARHFTGSATAALIAGALFAFHPARVTRVIHPYAFANQWTPLALLLAHRLLAHVPKPRASAVESDDGGGGAAPWAGVPAALRGWLEAIALAAVLCLQLLESFYQVLALAVLGGVYGLFLLVRHRDNLLAALPRLLFVALACVAFAALLFGPYLHTRAVWSVLEGRSSLYLRAADWGPGGGAWIGWTTAALAVIGLADRLRGPRREAGEDPRLVLLLAGLLVAWGTILAMRLPPFGIVVWSWLLIASEWVPGLASVRVLRATWLGAHLVACFLAAYGVLALLDLLREKRRAASIVTAALWLAVLLENFHPTLSRASFRRGTQLVALPIAAPKFEQQAYASVPPGAVLDLPLRYDLRGKLNDMSRYVLASAYHRRAVAACYNSFRTDLQNEIAALAARLPDRNAADSLYALGFRTLAVHVDLLSPRERAQLASLVGEGGHASLLASTRRLRLVSLTGPSEIDMSFAPLVRGRQLADAVAQPGAAEPSPGSAPRGESVAAPPRARIDLVLRNGATRHYLHPKPIEPTELIAIWRDAAGTEVASTPFRTLLPLALAPGEQAVRPIELPVTVPPGSYVVDFALATGDKHTIARSRVRVVGS